MLPVPAYPFVDNVLPYGNPDDHQGNSLDYFIFLDANYSDYTAHLFTLTVSYAFSSREGPFDGERASPPRDVFFGNFLSDCTAHVWGFNSVLRF